MQKLDYDLEEEYSHEINKIRNILNQLESERIYEKTGVKMDGYLTTNVQKLREQIFELLSKIQNGKDGEATNLAKWF